MADSTVAALVELVIALSCLLYFYYRIKRQIEKEREEAEKRWEAISRKSREDFPHDPPKYP